MPARNAGCALSRLTRRGEMIRMLIVHPWAAAYEAIEWSFAPSPRAP
jgi:hypothetical protein